MTCATRTSSPGRSGSSTLTVKMRSRLMRPDCTTDDIVMTSMLPPESTETTFLPVKSRWRSAATVSRPEFSTTILWLSTMSRKATTSSSSSTVMMPSRFCWM